MTLLGPSGKPISSAMFRKAEPPKTGEAFGAWAGREDTQFLSLPGGGAVQFNLDNLQLADFRAMRDHYQVNASLSVLTFMMHQLDFKIVSKDKRIADHCDENMRTIWTRLVRSKGQAFWAGYSPTVLEWENDVNGRTVQLNKIKDLMPEECRVNWKTTEGWAPPGKTGPTMKLFDGIKQAGQPYVIPVGNAYWYPLLMENGNYYGKKLLRPAFQSWFFSILIHLFSNRYFERFGEPLPVGRAPYDESVDVVQADGQTASIPGNQFMGSVIQQIRNRSVVVLPNDKTIGDPQNPDWDYQLQYLESQMRGADFERYMTRLDEEISLAMFMPLLLLRTGDVGSHNLGKEHMHLWLLVMNALAGDWAEYINRYILRPMVDYNFSPNAPDARIKFRELGKIDADTIRSLIQALVQNKQAQPDLEELGQIAGLTFTEIEEITTPDTDPEDDPDADRNSGNAPPQDDPNASKPGVAQLRSTANAISTRLAGQVSKAFRSQSFGEGFAPSLGYRRRFLESVKAHGYSDPERVTDEFFNRVERWVSEVSSIGQSEFATPDEFMSLFDTHLVNEVERIAAA